MLFFVFNNAYFLHCAKKLTQKSHTIVKPLFITNWVELINKKNLLKQH